MVERRESGDHDGAGAPGVLPAVTPHGLTRRSFIGFVLAAPTLVAGAQLGSGVFRSRVEAAVPSPPEPADLYDLTDLLTDAARPTSNLITVTVNPDGTASFALPRAEVGQGITTAIAMTIADELEIAVSQVDVTLADARPELLWNQLTGGSNTMHAMYTPVRVAAAVARGQLLEAASRELGVPVASLSVREGVVTARDGRRRTYGSLAAAAAAVETTAVRVELEDAAAMSIVGTPQTRVDAMDIVTGRKQFAMDLAVPNALPTMICRPPTINGTVVRVRNVNAVKSMPGVTDVCAIPSGVAVRARTFGQCIDAVRALRVDWGPGTVGTKSEADILAELGAAELPMAAPALPPLAQTIEQRFTFHFVSNTPLETNCAIADVRSDRAEIWSSLKSPIIAQQRIAEALGLSQDQVVCHVVQGGGSFGRHLFSDAALEAALASKAMAKPVKLMWHRTDDFRQGRMHPMCTSRVRASWAGADVVSYEQRHTSVSTDFTHGLGELITSMMAEAPTGNDGFAQSVFTLSQTVPYDFGATSQLIKETEPGFNTGSMRNVYSPNVTTARELVVDQLAKAMGRDPYAFRSEFLKDDRSKAVLDRVVHAGRWGRAMARGTAQGIGVHSEYKGRAACLVEIDCRPATVNRRVPHGYTGPRVTKVVYAVDVGLPVNPRGLEAQMMGGIMDAMALILSFSVHVKDGYVLEGSWDDGHYTRQWNVPFDLQIIVMPPTTGVPGGAGEFGVAAASAAIACAYARATGKVPTSFPINHAAPLDFEPFPTVPPIPPSPVDGLRQSREG